MSIRHVHLCTYNIISKFEGLPSQKKPKKSQAPPPPLFFSYHNLLESLLSDLFRRQTPPPPSPPGTTLTFLGSAAWLYSYTGMKWIHKDFLSVANPSVFGTMMGGGGLIFRVDFYFFILIEQRSCF
jgi:hypothetical protein